MWTGLFDERQQKEIRLCRVYAKDFSHGTDGHNAKMIIAKMAKILDDIHYAMAPLGIVNELDPQFAISTKRQIQNIMGFDLDDEEKSE